MNIATKINALHRMFWGGPYYVPGGGSKFTQFAPRIPEGEFGHQPAWGCCRCQAAFDKPDIREPEWGICRSVVACPECGCMDVVEYENDYGVRLAFKTVRRYKMEVK